MSKKLQLVGQRFGCLTVLRECDSKNNNSRWLCQCDCGTQVEVIGWNLTGNRTKQCVRCGYKATSDKKKLKLVIGQVFGYLKILNETTKPGDKQTRWKCQCRCGVILEVSGCNLNRSYTKSCKQCSSQIEGEKRKDGELAIGTWNKMVCSANVRNLEITISRQEALALFIQQGRKCALTGVHLKLERKTCETHADITASLDRIDSSLGYIKGNVQWVHRIVNMMKSNYQQKDFVNWCIKVADYQRDTNVASRIEKEKID